MQTNPDRDREKLDVGERYEERASESLELPSQMIIAKKVPSEFQKSKPEPFYKLDNVSSVKHELNLMSKIETSGGVTILPSIHSNQVADFTTDEQPNQVINKQASMMVATLTNKMIHVNSAIKTAPKLA